MNIAILHMLPKPFDRVYLVQTRVVKKASSDAAHLRLSLELCRAGREIEVLIS